MANKHFDVTEGPLLKKVILYTIPIILTNILQLLFNAADLMVVGSKSQDFVGAVGATTPLIGLMTNLFIGLGGGVSVVVAQSLGANTYGFTKKTVHTAIPLAFICGAFLTVLGFFFSSTFLSLMGTPDDLLFLSSKYMRIYSLGLIPSLVYNFAAAIMRAAGDTKGPLYFLLISGVINVLLNLMFVYLFNMDVDGVALATIISQTISAVLVLISLSKRQDACALSFKEFGIDRQALKKIILIGLPSGIHSSLYSIGNVMIQTSINSFGTVALSGISAAANLEGFAYVCINSFYHTALNFSGQNYGAGKLNRVKTVYKLCISCGLVVALIIAAIYGSLGKALLGFYSITDPTAVTFGYIRLLLISVPYALCAMMDITTGIMRGIGSSTLPMLLSIIGVCCLRLVWVFAFFEPFFPEKNYTAAVMLFLAYPVSWLVTYIAELIAFKITLKKKARLLEASQ